MCVDISDIYGLAHSSRRSARIGTLLVCFPHINLLIESFQHDNPKAHQPSRLLVRDTGFQVRVVTTVGQSPNNLTVGKKNMRTAVYNLVTKRTSSSNVKQHQFVRAHNKLSWLRGQIYRGYYLS